MFSVSTVWVAERHSSIKVSTLDSVLVRNGEELLVFGRWLEHPGVEKFEKVLKCNRVDIFDADLTGFDLFHSICEHCVKNGAARRENGTMRTETSSPTRNSTSVIFLLTAVPQSSSLQFESIILLMKFVIVLRSLTLKLIKKGQTNNPAGMLLIYNICSSYLKLINTLLSFIILASFHIA